MRFFTIGHSNVDMDEFLRLLRLHGMRHLVDIRSYPGSKKFPHFGKANLEAVLLANGFAYSHIESLGGRRRKQGVGANGGWTNVSFRNYADYTMTPEFVDGLVHLEILARNQPVGGVAYMCSEAVPWRCHRTIVSDNLVALGHQVTHLIGETRKDHVPGAWGPMPQIDAGRCVTYPPEQMELVV